MITRTGKTLILAAFCLSGCASMDQGDCETADWYGIGETDGLRGRAGDRHHNYGKDCAEFAINVDTDAYLDGWENGIIQYCTRDNGYRAGINGESDGGNCPPDLRGRFYNAYQLGRNIHEHRERVDTLRSEIVDLGDELAEDDLSDETRRALRKQRRRLKEQLDHEEWGLTRAMDEARDHGFSAY